jgi:serine/threonine protein kinase
MLGQGSYGCVFKPSLFCEGEKVVPPNTISKFMTEDSAENEMRIKDILERIDPDQNYFLYPLVNCKPSKRYKKSLRLPTNNIARCKIDIEDEEARLLRFKDGGVTLQTLVVQPAQYASFFSGLVTLLEGLALLHDNPVKPVYHLDIKNDNIVCDAALRCRFIDFGISDTQDRSSPVAVMGDFRSSIYPFEVQFLNRFTLQGKPISEIAYAVDHAFLEDFRADRYFFPADMVIPHEDHKFLKKYKLADNLLEYEVALEKKIRTDYPEDSPEFTDFLYSAADVFSLGKVLSYLYGRHMGQFLQFSDDHGEGHLFFLDSQGRRKQYMKGQHYKGLVDELTDPEQITWLSTIYDKISFPFYKLMLNMLTLDPYKRISAANAAEAYKAIIPAIEALLTEEKITKYMAFMAPHLPYGQRHDAPLNRNQKISMNKPNRAYSMKLKNRTKLNKQTRSMGRNVVLNKNHRYWEKYD